MVRRIVVLSLAVVALASCDRGPSPIRIIGSSTVYPFSKAVATTFAGAKKGEAPVVEETGTVAGFTRFCDSEGPDSIDIADASRRMTRAEYQTCQDKQVGEIMEIPIGLDGIAIAESNAGPKLALTSKDIYLALAANPRGKPNAAKTWKDVNPSLPAIAIRVVGPPPSSGTRDVFETMVLQPGCLEAMPEAKALQTAADPSQFDQACRAIRGDGAYVQSGENDDLIVKGLEENPDTIGVFGYSFLEQNASRLRGLTINGFSPDVATIQSGKYPATRTLYLYVKLKHLKSKPALQDFLNLYATMLEPGGPLVKLGLIAMSDSARQRSAGRIQRGEALDPQTLL